MVKMSEDYTLVPATDRDFDILMTWFSAAAEVDVWGGPGFRYPFTPQSFREDCRWPDMDSFFLRDSQDAPRAFGQYYDRNGVMHLARLIVAPEARGGGLGRELVTRLMEAAAARLPLDEFSLFVYRDNTPALRLYRSLGFEIQDYPPDQVMADTCYFLTRPRS